VSLSLNKANLDNLASGIWKYAGRLCDNFPYAFLEVFGNKETTIKRLRAGASNKSDLGGVLILTTSTSLHATQGRSRRR
jgi:hypothetical protein